jgi:tetratricopeptide (TPR) repeat protein
MNQTTQNRLAQAETLLREGKLTSSHFALRKVLRQEPDNVDALTMEAELHLRAGRQLDASDLISEILEKDASAFNRNQQLRLATLCLEVELFFDAARLFEWARSKEKLDALHLYQAGIAMRRLGEMYTAEQRLLECIKTRPGVAAPFLQLGHVYKATGLSHRAAHYYGKYLILSENEKGTGYWSLADLKDHVFSDEEIAAMEAELDRRRDDPPQASALHFALGSAAEQKQDYARAIDHYNQGNAIQSALKPFSAGQFKQIVEGLQGVDGTEVPATEDQGPVPLLIVGLPRTGTTLIEQILSAHSRVQATDELPFLERIALKLEMNGGYPDRLRAMTEEERLFLRQQYRNGAGAYLRQDCDYFIDKYPGNFLHIGLAKRIFPECIVIDARRDLRDTAISAYRQLFQSRGEFASSFDGILDYYRGYRRMMAHWENAYPGKVKVVQYEQLVTEPREEIQSLLEFCGFETEEACFEFHKQKRAVTTPSVAQVTQPMFTSSIGQWRKYEAFIPDELAKLAGEN